MDEKDIAIEAFNFLGKYVATKAIDGLGGKNIPAFVEKLTAIGKDRVKNFGQIVERAFKKADQQGKPFPNEVAPRVVERILNEGSYCAEAIMQEYYAGVLLSNDGGFVDDEGIFYLSTIHRLSSVQLKAHYALYYIIRNINEGKLFDILGGTEPRTRPVPISGLTYVRADVLLTTIYGQNPVDESKLKSIEDKRSQYQYYIDQIVQGLKKENLVRCFFTATDQNLLGEANYNYFFFAPTLEGLQLYLWGQGYGKKRAEDFLKSEIVFVYLEGFHLAENQVHNELYGTYNQSDTNNPTFNKQFLLDQVRQKFDR